MPQFKVKTPISVGRRNDKGEVETKEVSAGETVELSKEEAQAMPWAIEKAPEPKMDKDLAEAVRSVKARPDHPESGIRADWKVDEFAKANRASEPGVDLGGGFARTNEPDADAKSLPEGGSPVGASDIPPGATVDKDGKVTAEKGSAVEKKSK
jgi:hypothetical protein